MPRGVAEISSGNQFQFSSNQGQAAASQTRVFRVLLSTPQETFDIQQTCGVFIGDSHPNNPALFCTSYSYQYDGDTRVVLLCTFNYEATASASNSTSQQDPKQSSPDVRPANWSITSSLMEVPALTWRDRSGPNSNLEGFVAAINVCGDRYEGITRLEPVVSISIEQFETTDPSKYALYAGTVNKNQANFGSLTCPPRSLMFRGVTMRPVIESFGSLLYRGWMGTFEFAYRRNYTLYHNTSGTETPGPIGWDIVVPQTGFNVKAFTPSAATNIQEVYGQPLKHEDGKIATPLALPANVSAGDKVRAMVKVFEYVSGGASQTPSAQPIPINNDGSPRIDTASPKVLVYRYQLYEEYDFDNFNLRLT